MAVTPIFICGAECGIAAVGTASPAVEHWAAVSGAVTVVTSGPSPMRSERAFRCNPSAADAYLSHTFASTIASPATAVHRTYVYFATLPNADTWLCRYSPGGISSGAVFKQSDSKIYARFNATVGATGIAVTTGQWYRIDVKVVYNTTSTADVQVNGSACGQASVAGSASGVSIVDVGLIPVSGTISADAYFDDIIVSGTSGDYPIGDGTVVGLYPSGDGTHNYSATTDFLDGGTAQAALAAAGSEVDTWLSLRSKADGGLSTTVDNSNFVTNATGATTEYLRWVFESLPADANTVNGVASVSTHHAASATGNTQTLFLHDAATAANNLAILGTWNSATLTAVSGVDLSDTTIIVVYKCLPTPPDLTPPWTVTKVNDVVAWWSSTDVNPDAYIDGICLEVDYVPTVATFEGQPHVIVMPSMAAQQASRW